MEENNDEINQVVEKPKKKNGGLVGAFIIIIVLLLVLIGYLCYDKFLAKKDEPAIPKEVEKKPEEKPIDEQKQLPSEAEKKGTDPDENKIVCETFRDKTLTYKQFNDSYYNSDECTKYLISDLGIELIDKSIDKDSDSYYVHDFTIKIANQESNLVVHSLPVYNIELGKFNNYIVIRGNAAGDDMTQIDIYDKSNGHLIYSIPMFDDNNCQYVVSKSDGEVIVYQDYALDEELFASNTCDADNLEKSFQTYCASGNYLRITKKLEEVDGVFKLKEQNIKCETLTDN